jgi:hypothetical protein
MCTDWNCARADGVLYNMKLLFPKQGTLHQLNNYELLWEDIVHWSWLDFWKINTEHETNLRNVTCYIWIVSPSDFVLCK